jgi:hypothetical protein
MKTNIPSQRTFITGGPFAALLLLSALASVGNAPAANPPSGNAPSVGASAQMSGDNNGPWTPEQSKTADHRPGTPSDPRGFNPPVTPPPPPAPPCTPPTHYTPPDNNGQWSPGQSQTANHAPGTPNDPRGFYPPPAAPGNASDSSSLGDLADKINRLDPANRWYQGGKSITRIYDAAKKGDGTRLTVELADGVGRFSSITEGALIGAAKGAPGGWPGMIIGGIIGGWLGKTAWDNTGGRLNDYSRNALDKLQGVPPAGQPGPAGANNGPPPTGPQPGATPGGLPPGANRVPGPNAGGPPPGGIQVPGGGGPPPGGVHQGNPPVPLPPTSSGGGGYIGGSGGGTSSGGGYIGGGGGGTSSGGSCPNNGSCPP